MIRGEIWWADLNPARGGEIRKHRPVAVMSVSALARHRRTIVAVPLSSSPKASWPIVVDLPSIGGRSVAVCDQIRALDRSRFDKRLGALDDDDLERLGEALCLTLGI